MNSIYSKSLVRRILRLVLPLAGLFCLVGIALIGVKLAQANVTLSGTVTGQSVADGINIRWTTASETGTQTFYLLRSTDEKGSFQPVPICIRDNKDDGVFVNAIFAQGDISGFSYEVTDLAIDLNSGSQRVDDLTNGQTYYYLLVEKDANGYITYPRDMAVVTYNAGNPGPTPSTQPCPIASPLPGVTPGPLPSPTTVLTTTVTVTPTITPSVTPTATVTITGTATITPTVTPSFTPSLTPSATPSLAPPTITPTWTPSWTPTWTPSLTPPSTSYPGPGATATTDPNSGFTSTPTPTLNAYPGSADPTPTETPFGADLLTPDATGTAAAEITPTPLAEEEATPTPTETPVEDPTLTPSPEQPTVEVVVDTATPTPTPTVTLTPTFTPTRTPVAVANLMPPPRPVGLSAAQVQVIGQPPAPTTRLTAGLGSFAASLAGLGLFFLALALWQMFRRSA